MKATTDGVDALIQRVKLRRELPPEERKRIREEAHVSMRELGAAVGVSFTAINNWEKGGWPQNAEHEARYLRILYALRDELAD